ncbi:aldose 1-epimerase family protein [Microbacterium thalli]|uniref:Aldose 1-epimerase family protein n=1 Tax=Microbacterium thalli TaxID=3027921 RepID=A0ABT5SFF8_9MICO|nr:aldose 1-epimerase family protein [Microbacterium thalli]MDD7961482.1 aldose 1-epimerase family protein [Microbacterium thalli]
MAASGTSYVLRAGEAEAIIASVGASLRSYRVDGRDLVVPYGEDEVRPGYRGATLAPWPNRVVDGEYEVAGTRYKLALTEPQRHHALHGLVAWLDFDAVVVAADHVTLAATVVAQTAYPWTMRVETTYRLGADGLTQTVRATNESADAAPFGTGPHPYLVAGASPLDEWTLELPADRVLEVTPDRLAPIALADVAGSERFDFREPRTLGAVEIDHAFTDVSRSASGEATVRVTDPAGTGVAISWGEACAWVQVHTADLPGGPAQPGHRAGLAVEPMTCAPDAFNASRYDYDAGLIFIQPGASSEASWRISAL